MAKRKKSIVVRGKSTEGVSASTSVVIPPAGDLFARVAAILEQARSNVVRAVNSNMVLAYWLIGREIVQASQGGSRRAGYGETVLADLSKKMTTRFGGGFSETNLKYFRTFYLVYAHRSILIGHPVGDRSIASFTATGAPAIRRPTGDELKHPSAASPAIPHSSDPEPVALTEKGILAGDKSRPGFSPHLSWSHYRALMRVQKTEARLFYEEEAIGGAWDKRTLERQIHSHYYERLLRSQQPDKMRTNASETLAVRTPAIESLKNPYVLEFLDFPEVAALHESDLEAAILSRLQAFLLELGKGFAFVARQQRLRFEDEERYVDLVFYHCRLKFYLLIDLKLGELTHQDVGQMDGYVRMFDDQVAGEGDNPTIGLILCAEKNEAVAKYSVLKDRKQIFASKYMLYLPTEAELRREIQRERRMIEESRERTSRENEQP